MLDPDLNDEEIAKQLAAFFCRITDEFRPIEDDFRLSSFDSPFPLLQPHKIASRIRQSKKPKSAVDGNLLPSLVNNYSDVIAIPATRIINYSFATETWPSPWKKET